MEERFDLWGAADKSIMLKFHIHNLSHKMRQKSVVLTALSDRRLYWYACGP